MRAPKPLRYVVVPFIYIGVILGLLFLQFSGTLAVRHEFGPLRFNATIAPGKDETSTTITSARVEYRGLLFELSAQRPITLHGPKGQQTALLPTRFTIEPNGVAIELSDESVVSFALTDSEPRELHVAPQATIMWPSEGYVEVPYRFIDTIATLDESASTPETRVVMVQGERHFLSVPPRTEFVAEAVRVPLFATSQLIRFAQMTGQRANIVETAFSGGRRAISDTFYANAIRSFIDTAYIGWGQQRFNGGSGTWTMREGSPRFSEQILTAYLAEAWRRNDYVTAFNQMRRAADLHPQEVGLRSAPFLGNLRVVTRRFVEQDRLRAQALTARVAAADLTVFREEDLIEFAALRAGEALYAAVIELAEVADYRSVDMITAIGMLNSYAGTVHPAPRSEAASSRFRAIVEERIFPAITQFEDYFFIETGRGEVDVWQSMRAGQILQQLGARENAPLLVTIGRNLVLSGLQMADQNGFLPALLLFGPTGIQGREGSFGPERLYHILSDNPHYPRLVSLYQTNGAGSFLYTVAGISSMNLTADQHRFRLNYPRNRTFYLIMQGVRPFSQMQLFRLVWRNDPSFESYIKGRHYEESTRTLMIKYTDDSVEEDIILFYR